MDYKKLSKEFYKRNTVQIAKDLLGKILVRQGNDYELVGKIVEVEAYKQNDPASHSFKGKTLRNEVMFSEGGILYVYFTYGMYYCCNVVTENEGIGSAVLLRALEPIFGLDLMHRNRKHCNRERDLANGPGKLCISFQIDKKLNGANLAGDEIFIAEDYSQDKFRIQSSQRIGISLNKDKKWRFFIKNNPFVSKTKV